MTSSRPSTLASDSTAAARQAESPGRTEALEPQLLFEQINRTVVCLFYFYLLYYYFIILFHCR